MAIFNKKPDYMEEANRMFEFILGIIEKEEDSSTFEEMEFTDSRGKKLEIKAKRDLKTGNISISGVLYSVGMPNFVIAQVEGTGKKRESDKEKRLQVTVIKDEGSLDKDKVVESEAQYGFERRLRDFKREGFERYSEAKEAANAEEELIELKKSTEAEATARRAEEMRPLIKAHRENALQKRKEYVIPIIESILSICKQYKSAGKVSPYEGTLADQFSITADMQHATRIGIPCADIVYHNSEMPSCKFTVRSDRPSKGDIGERAVSSNYRSYCALVSSYSRGDAIYGASAGGGFSDINRMCESDLIILDLIYFVQQFAAAAKRDGVVLSLEIEKQVEQCGVVKDFLGRFESESNYDNIKTGLENPGGNGTREIQDYLVPVENLLR